MFREIPFTNEFNEVINPGDVVIFAATKWKNTFIRKGVFEGCNVDEKGNVTSVRVNSKHKRWGRVDGKYGYYTGDYRSTLPLKRVYKSADSLIDKSF